MYQTPPDRYRSTRQQPRTEPFVELQGNEAVPTSQQEQDTLGAAAAPMQGQSPQGGTQVNDGEALHMSGAQTRPTVAQPAGLQPMQTGSNPTRPQPMLAVTQPTGLSAISINDQNSLEQHYSTTNMDLFMADKYITGLYNQITQGYIHTTGLVEEGGELNFVTV